MRAVGRWLRMRVTLSSCTLWSTLATTWGCRSSRKESRIMRRWMPAGLGCDYAQGDYVSRPLPVAETMTWLSRQALCRGTGPEPRLETVMSPDDVQRRLSGEVG